MKQECTQWVDEGRLVLVITWLLSQNIGQELKNQKTRMQDLHKSIKNK